MPLTRLDNLISSKTGKYLYVSPDDFNATDALSNRGNSPVTPFKSIQRAFLEIARYSYLPGFDNDRFDQFSIMLMPGIHYIDNRPGLVDTTGIDVFGFDDTNNQWTDNSILDISNPDNVLYKFNNTEGGAIIPRGSSLVGYDLRRTVVRPLYVPDPASVTVPRSAIFNVTGGCYFWQFTLKDGQTTAESPLYNTLEGTGEVYYDPNDFTRKTAPNYSHHKLTVFEYADTEELSLFYRKIAKGFSDYQPTIDDPGEFDFRVQENRIVGPLSDSRVIESLTLNDATTIPSIAASTSEIEVTTKTDHGYFAGQFVAISNTNIDSVLEGIFPIKSIDQNDPRKFTYEVAIVVSAIGTSIASGDTISVDTTPALGQNAQTLAEVDSVESASPYVFNVSIRSTWGICGIWANGLKATGFKSMVIAQYTGVSLQKDDRAFIRYEEYSNTWNQASLTDAFATVPYHAKGDSYWKDDWRTFHVKASEDAFIQNVSIFAVGFADHFLMESGGDMSITNSNSNFGNTSLHAIGFKGFAFNQDKGGYITDIIPPKRVVENSSTEKKVQYYTIDIKGTVSDSTNYTKLFLGSEDIVTPDARPAVTLDGFRIGAKSNEKLYVRLDPATSGGAEIFNVALQPTGFVKYVASPSILNPSGTAINNVNADAANLIESNRKMIQEEVFGYILEKYPRLQNISYVNPGRDPNANRFFDGANLIINNRTEIVNEVITSTSQYDTSSPITSDDVREMVDAITEDIRDGGNSNIIALTKTYFNGIGQVNKYANKVSTVMWAIARTRDLCKKAIGNLLTVKANLYDPNPNSALTGYSNLPIGNITAGSIGSDNVNGVTIDASSTVDPASRYRDTWNLIQSNRDYILDNALAEIAVYDETPFFSFPGDPSETTRSRFKTAYRLIRRNKDDAQSYAINQIQTQFPSFVFPGGSSTKCRRDIGYFIDAVAMDVFLGGNLWTRTFISKYFESGGQSWITGGLQGEESQSNFGFNAARDRLIEAVSNQLSSGYTDTTVSPGEAVYGDGNGDIANTNSAACTDVQNAISSLTSIVTQVVSDGNTDSISVSTNPNYVTPTSRVLQAGESKCRRDIGYIVDAVQQDLWFGGNAYSVTAAKAYFDASQTPISNGLLGEESQSIVAFKRASDAINLAINNQLYYKDNTITLDQVGDPPIVSDMNADAYEMVLDNKEFLAFEAYERMLTAFPSYTPQTTNTAQDCKDDVINVLEEVMYDVKFGGNAKAYDSAEIYITNVMPYFGASKRTKEFTPTNVTYDPATGVSVLTIPGHDMTVGNYVKLADNSITMTCAMDNNQTQHTYPRSTDANSGQWTQITAITESTVTLNVGVSGPDVTFTPQVGTTYDSTSGEMVIEIGAHTLSVGEGVVLLDNSFTFTCAQDGNLTQNTYPRPGQDPFAGKSIPITARTASTITINVGDAGTASGVAHTFVSANPNAVQHLPQRAHTFVSAATNSVKYGVAAETFIDAERDEAARVFTEVRNLIPDILRRNTITGLSIANGFTQIIDTTVTDDWDTPACATAISAVQSGLDTIIQAIGTDAGVGNLTGITRTEPTQPSISDVLPQPGGYTPGNCSDVVSTVNTLISIICDSTAAGNLSSLPPVDNGLWDCANVRTSIETLSDIFSDAVQFGTLDELPVQSSGGYATDATQSKCYRDVSYIVDAVVNDLRLGGNINSIQAGEAYFVGMDLEYIDGEKSETLDAWSYVGNMAIAAMRNFDFLAFNCNITTGSAIVDIGDTSGVLIGMEVVEYDNSNPSNPAYVNGLLQSGSTPLYTSIPEGTYVKSIVSSSTIELGTKNSRLSVGSLVNALQTSTSIELYFTFGNGQWADTLPKTVVVGPAGTGADVIQDTLTSSTRRECAPTASAITTLIGNINTIINSGVGSVARQEPTAGIGAFTNRATVFTIDTTGTGASNPHDFETGTPVRLAPRPRFDTVTGKYVDVDKRLIRLPNGFETNRTYYVIAPGRTTKPADYSSTTLFNGSDQTKLMLATSKENAAAGIYIYASESNSIDANVEIDIYQFVLDQSYDLHEYEGSITTTVEGGIQTNVSNIFDVPFASVTEQKVFFRATDGSSLPLVSTTDASNPEIAVTDVTSADIGRINPNKEFFVRYQNSKVFTIHTTKADSINNVNPVRFIGGQSLKFNVYANKRRSPVRFDPGFQLDSITTGKWYLQCIDEGSSNISVTTREENIFWRIKQSDYSDRARTTDSWFIRTEDEREAEDRTYKIRYVIPSYLENARDPINGFVIKTRTDDTRRLVPQVVTLKPVVGNVYGARFENPVQAGEFIGQTVQQLGGLANDQSYDPYRKDQTNSGTEYRKFAKFSSGLQATIQSARYVEDPIDSTIRYLQLSLVDHTVDSLNFPGLRNEQFTTIPISAPQGGTFVTNKTANIASSQIQWTGYSSGIANIHAYLTINGLHYLIVKNIRGGKLEYSEFSNTRFTQGTVFADMLDDQDMGKSLPLKTLIRKNYPEYYYKQNGANVYTITPGDRITDDDGIEYFVDSVADAGVIEDTFYVFSYETLQRRISGQQDGIYYLSCLRGNISPFPTGAGVAENFKKFRFSQPVSRLFPLNYKNDPLWFQKNGTTAEELNFASQQLDPPPTYSAADNYVHGLVTVNDNKNSVTKELVEDLLNNPAFIANTYTGSNKVGAQEGNATSGSEDRLIPIAGDSRVLVDQKYYVELRRPSIARAGNHTFEYLGFGPGNYSTGLPARQEIVLSAEEDFYAQAKREDAGIVFYTGLNSNGDLYIGNRKINAITGEETFLEAAVLQDSEDENDSIGNLVTSFDTPVTFNQNITVVGGDGTLQNVFQSPLIVSVQDNDLTEIRDSLIIRSNVSSVDPVTQFEQDELLDRTSFSNPGSPLDGDIRISKNRINAAIFGWNPRGKGQKYQIQTHTTNGVPSNITPNNNNTIAAGGDRLFLNQVTNYSGVQPSSGDILFKGKELGKSGSIGWALCNFFSDIATNQIFSIEFNGTNVVKLTFLQQGTGLPIQNNAIGLDSGSQIRFSNYPNPLLNGTWTVFSPNGDPFLPTNNYIQFQINDNITVETISWNGAGGIISQSASTVVEFANFGWKEFGVIGGEAIRTETETIGDYKLGVNTIARSSHEASQNAFVSVETGPRANLDVVGTAFISGKKINSYLTEVGNVKTETNQDNAFLVGGDSTTPNDPAVLRVMTTNGGRLGINTSLGDTVNPSNNLDTDFVVVGDSRMQGNLNLALDLQVNGGDITSTNGTFNFVNQGPTIFNAAGDATQVNIFGGATGEQTLRVGSGSTNQTLLIGEAAAIGNLRIHRNVTSSTVEIGTSENNTTSISKVFLGGAFESRSTTNSIAEIRTFQTKIFGNLEIGSGYGAGQEGPATLSTRCRVASIFAGDETNTVNLATNATTFTLGSTGGTTTIRNTLNVLASTIVEGNIRLDGGLNAGIIKVSRGRFGTTPTPHLIAGVNNPNIDFYKYNATGKLIDTAGVSPWGGTNFLVAGGQVASIDTITGDNDTSRVVNNYPFVTATSSGAGQGASFTVIVRSDFTIDITINSPGEGYSVGEIITITDIQLGGGGAADITFRVAQVNSGGSTYFLPITTPATSDFRVGDLLLIDREDSQSPEVNGNRDEAQSEIVRIEGLANVANAADPNGYRLIVSRGQEGTTLATNHPDNCVIARLEKQSNASYITGSDLDNNGVLDEPLSGIGGGSADVNIGVAEFGGTLSTRDFIRLTGTEFVSIVELISTSPQTLSVNDGGSPAAEVFKVESTTGDTYIFGDILAGSGFNKFTVNSETGNTNIAGTLTTENSITLNGAGLAGNEYFKITNGGPYVDPDPTNNIPLVTTFEIDSANGNIINRGGNMQFFNLAGDTLRLDFVNSSGDFKVFGSFSALGSGASRFGGPIIIGNVFGTNNNTNEFKYSEDCDLTINGGDLTINSVINGAAVETFKVSNNGSLKVAGIDNYISSSGGDLWLYENNAIIQAEPNRNYFVNCQNSVTLLKLPPDAQMGDTISIIDTSGSLTFNQTLVVRAQDDISVQGDRSNTGSNMLVGIPPSSYAGFGGGELVVQTPNAAFTLVFAGSTTAGGDPGAAGNQVGWYLTDV